MIKNKQEISILVNGNSVKEYQHEGNTFIEAKSGSTFSIKLKNNYSGRVMAVISVDGVDVITGENAVETESGYVIGGNSSIEIKGYRVDSEHEASFKFIEKNSGKGYAEFKGDSSNVGVIGIRFYSEDTTLSFDFIGKILTDSKPKKDDAFDFPPNYPKPYYPIANPWIDKHPLPYYPNDMGTPYPRPNQIWCGNLPQPDMSFKKSLSDFSSENASINCSAQNLSNMEPKGFDMTTEFGNKVQSKISTVEFKKGNLISESSIYYASRESLKEMGIKFEKILEVKLPKAFDKNMKFCTPPTNWKG